MSICFTCGRCCFGQQDYVQVFDEDLKRGSRVGDLCVVSGDKRFMQMSDGHCAALDCSDGAFRCSIYEQRPSICRVYQQGAVGSACPPGVEKVPRAGEFGVE